jgi:protein-disulfide isomerase
MTHHLATPIGPRDHLFGSRHAPVVLVEYGDYECPYCGQAYGIVKELQRRFGDALAFAFRNFPLVEVHPHALRAAETAEWAGLARRFWPMHDYLFEHQDQLEPAALLEAVSGLELDRNGVRHEGSWELEDLVEAIAAAARRV